MKSIRPVVAVGILAATVVALAAEPQLVDRAASSGLQFGPDTTVITEPLSPDGLPDYVEALNRQLSAGVARDENFWVLMWPAIGNAERTREEYIREVEQRLDIRIAREPRMGDPVRMAGLQYGTPEGDRINKQQSEASTRPWSRQEFPEIARWVDAHAAVLDEVHAACLRPKAYAPLIAGDGQPALVQVLLPHVQTLRAAARLLSARAMLRLSEGDVEGSWQDLLDLQRLASHSERGFTLIEALVGYAIRAVAEQPTVHWITQSGQSADQLADRRAILLPLTRTESLARSIDSERYMYLDVVITLMSGRATSRETMGLIDSGVQLIDTGDGAAEAFSQLRNAREMLFQLLLLGSDINETLRYGNAMYNDLVAAVQPDTHAERQARLDAIDARVEKDSELTRNTGSLVKAYFFASRKDLQQMPGRVLTGLLMPAVASVETAYSRTEAWTALLDASLAVQSHILRTGNVPLSLAELKSTGGPFIDPFTGKDLLLKLDDRGVVLYSVGPNGGDDGGRSHNEGTGSDDLRVILTVAP